MLNKFCFLLVANLTLCNHLYSEQTDNNATFNYWSIPSKPNDLSNIRGFVVKIDNKNIVFLTESNRDIPKQAALSGFYTGIIASGLSGAIRYVLPHDEFKKILLYALRDGFILGLFAGILHGTTEVFYWLGRINQAFDMAQITGGSCTLLTEENLQDF
jgi:hypothetical protein